jgi:D-beta-D-heptose 7-phosphate kinase/D-beta-D-heptose 1-phosphate adenosyltransferase
VDHFRRDQAQRLLDHFSRLTILIVGDIMLDEFVIGHVNRISPEAPVPVVEYDHSEHRLGGAANVANNVQALGGRACLFGVVGDDLTGDQVAQGLAALGLSADGVLRDPARPTTRKLRIVTKRNQQVVRVDYESEAELSPDVESRLISQIEERSDDAAAILVSDYMKGVITRQLMARLVTIADDRRIPLLVDPKIPHLDLYTRTSLVTPNHQEAEVATHMRIRTSGEAREAARLLQKRLNCESVLITRGEHGMWLLEGSRDGDRSVPTREADLPAMAREVADVTGAGDTVIGTIALGLAAGAGLVEAARLATYAASVVVGRFGPAVVSPSELLGAME